MPEVIIFYLDDKNTELESINGMVEYVKTDDILCDMQSIINASQSVAYKAVNLALLRRNWLLRYRIAEEELKGEKRAEYGSSTIQKLAKELSEIYGRGYTKSNLYSFYAFYKAYHQIFQSVSGKSPNLLSWTHYRALLQVNDKKAREWYEKEAIEEMWSVHYTTAQYFFPILLPFTEVTGQRACQAGDVGNNVTI